MTRVLSSNPNVITTLWSYYISKVEPSSSQGLFVHIDGNVTEYYTFRPETSKVRSDGTRRGGKERKVSGSLRVTSHRDLRTPSCTTSSTTVLLYDSYINYRSFPNY